MFIIYCTKSPWTKKNTRWRYDMVFTFIWMWWFWCTLYPKTFVAVRYKDKQFSPSHPPHFSYNGKLLMQIWCKTGLKLTFPTNWPTGLVSCSFYWPDKTFSGLHTVQNVKITRLFQLSTKPCKLRSRVSKFFLPTILRPVQNRFYWPYRKSNSHRPADQR